VNMEPRAPGRASSCAVRSRSRFKRMNMMPWLAWPGAPRARATAEKKTRVSGYSEAIFSACRTYWSVASLVDPSGVMITATITPLSSSGRNSCGISR